MSDYNYSDDFDEDTKEVVIQDKKRGKENGADSSTTKIKKQSKSGKEEDVSEAELKDYIDSDLPPAIRSDSPE